MIYLIDDKKLRQSKDYDWTKDRLEKYKNAITCIYTLEELEQQKINIFSNNNVILYHESFLDTTYLSNEALVRRNILTEWSEKNDNLLVYFSGSKDTRKIENNIASIPVSVLYKNLETFILKYQQNDINLKYLLFGDNYILEESLSNRIKSVLDIENKSSSNQVSIEGNTLYIKPFENYLIRPVIDCTSETIYDNSDSELTLFIEKRLSNNDFDFIYLPLCFGSTLSDFSGLKLASHIRCADGPNQLKPIFIYGVVSLDELLQDKYFSILRTKNVFLIPLSKQAFFDSSKMTLNLLTIEELPFEISKLNLKIPDDFDDNHSIKNELAIYQWAKVLDIKLNDELERNLDLVTTNLYFRYWQTINPIKSKELVDSNFLKIKSDIKPKILLIDDEASKGWYEIFAYILGNINGFEVNYLGDGFRNLSRGEIINQCINKIKEEDIDIVILDFRLHPLDYNSETSEENTSVQLLKKIKETNPGIQVIGFSATDKIWNLQYLQQEGVDFFIYKSTDSKGVMHLINAIKQSTIKANPLKKFVTSASEIKKLSKQYGNVPTEGDNRFSSNVESNLEIAFELFSNSFTKEKHRNYAFLQLFLILEEFIKLEDIFEEGSEFIVKLGTEEKDQICVAKNLKNQIETAIKMTNNGKYELDRNNFPVSKKWKRFDTNFIISAILIFRLGNKNSSVKGWTNIYTNRNKKVGHYDRNTPNSFIEKKDIFELLNFILYIMDSNNINTGNYDKGLKRQTFDESIEHAMKNDPRFKSSK